MAKLLGG
jgi:DNA mismatch repair protein MSH4